MDAAAALHFWFCRTDFERRPVRYCEFHLDRVRRLLGRLGDPHLAYPVLHVAGTKGKGSTAAMLARVLRAAGYRTGLYTSPHLSDVRERIQIDGELIGLELLTASVHEVEAAVRAGGDEDDPTVFEVGTALAFLHFQRQAVGAAVIEVGLGGRLDATNVCQPRVSVITSISLDHTAQLGPTTASIAREKAGIIKPGVPVISGATDADAREVIRAVAAERGAELIELDRDLTYSADLGRVDRDGRITPTAVEIAFDGVNHGPYQLGLLGEHQAANAALAVAAIRRSGLTVDDSAIARGLREVAWPARLEVFAGRPLVVLDCAHNPASARALAEAVKSAFPPGRRVLVFASARDKDANGMLRELLPHFDEVIYTKFANNPRVTAADQFAEWHRAIAPETPFRVVESAAEALAQARSRDKAEMVCVAGSVFLAGELRPVLTASTDATPPIG